MSPFLLRIAGAAIPPGSGVNGGEASSFLPRTLYITISPDGAAVRMGTCEHCVIHEHTRPDRAWDADGDQDLDFDRETLLAYLAELGITLDDRQAYVCP